MRRPPHRTAHEDCPTGSASWSECDKATGNAKSDWDAMQQVILAYNIVNQGRRIDEDNVFSSLIDYISGRAADMLNDEGNPNRSAWCMRLRAAIERFKAGDLPSYNLYEPIALSAAEQEA